MSDTFHRSCVSRRRFAQQCSALAAASIFSLSELRSVRGDQSTNPSEAGDHTLFTTAESAKVYPVSDPSEAGMVAATLEKIEGLVSGPIAEGDFPGCVIAIGRGSKVVYLRAFGNRSLKPNTTPMQTDTIFDLASLTKSIATSSAIMRLVDQGKLDLHQTIASIVPAFAENGKGEITIADCLLHQSGLVADNAMSDYEDGVEEAWRRIYAMKMVAPLRSEMIYSDMNFIMLAEIVRILSGKPHEQFVQDEVFGPLGMCETGYLPAQRFTREQLASRVAPTQPHVRSADLDVAASWDLGGVHDPRAYALGGVAGHAGLFSTASDLCIFGQMMLGHGALPQATQRPYGQTNEEVRIVSETTWDLWTKPRYSGGTADLRAYGWDARSGFSGNRGRSLSPRSFGHGGFTGTGMWIDPANDLYVIFLANRVHPSGEGACNSLIRDVGSVAADAIDWSAPPAPRVILAPWTQVEFVDTTKSGEPAKSTESMAKITPVLTGIDVLRRDGFQALAGMKIGLITNPTGVARDGVSDITLLHEAEQVQLEKLFSPEHGLYALKDEKVTDETDSATGLHVYSLYGETRRPTAEMLEGIDTLVFDIQDIGTRFYTYMSTMGEAMVAAAEHGKRFIVLDRPNPIDGVRVEGTITDPGRESFIAWDAIPLRHGMTMGELAQFFKQSRKLETLQLEIIRCEGWLRGTRFDQTGLPWVSPSPNMRNLTEELLYPGMGLLETTNVSVGRGTGTPFEWFGAPWLDLAAAEKLVESLDALKLPGIFFATCRFTPDASVHKDAECHGVQLTLTDPDQFNSVRTGIEIACQLQKLFGDQWNGTKGFDRLLVHQTTLDGVLSRQSYETLSAAWQPALDTFMAKRAELLLYGTQQS
ncbi:MAG: DUF1343 domain-containing protein [Thermoguttaceae bacterium]|nr:DUF1343 domain-containing protein [Thermoguttaceae bacterium]